MDIDEQMNIDESQNCDGESKKPDKKRERTVLFHVQEILENSKSSIPAESRLGLPGWDGREDRDQKAARGNFGDNR